MPIPQPTPPSGPYDPMFGLQERVAALLTPVFQDTRTSELFAYQIAYQIACRSLQAYEPETRADFVNAARTIAFSLASLAVIRDVFDPDLQPGDKKRIAIHANALNRSADQAERSMMDRRRYRKAYPSYPVPQQAAPEPEPPEPEPPAREPPAREPPAREPPAREPNDAEPTDAEVRTRVAQAVTAHATARRNPPRPQVNLAPPPIQHAAIRHGGPDRTSMPPRRADPLITPAMLDAFAPDAPSPHPG